MKRFPVLLAAFAATLLSLAFPVAHAADKTWTGAASRLMSDGANWSDGLAPARGDRLFFPESSEMHVQNDLVDASFDSLHFSGGNVFGASYILYGNQLALTGAPTVVVSGPIVAFVTLNIAFRSQYVRFWTTGAPIPGYNLPALEFSYGQLQLSGGLLEVTAEVGDIGIGADVTETAPTSIETQGFVSFSGNSSFTGSVYSFGGSLDIGSANALGSAVGATYVGGASQLKFYNPALGGPEMVVPEPFVLDNTPDTSIFGSIVAISAGPLRLTGDIAVLTPQVIQTNVPLQFDGRISGPGHVVIDLAEGDVTFTNGQNTFDGGLDLRRGVLRAHNSLALGFMNSVDASLAMVDLGYTFQALTRFTCRGARVRAVVGAAEVSVRDGATLAGCGLEPLMWPGFIPQSGQVLTVIRNGSGTPLQGEFDFFGEGTVLDVNGVRTTATYHAGSGNDFAFVAEVLPIAALQLRGGTMQSLQLGEQSVVPLSVQAYDRFGRAVVNASITFSSPPDCGTFNGAQSVTVTTNSTGFAKAPPFTAGSRSQVCFVQGKGDTGPTASFELHLYAPGDVVITPLPASLATITNQPFNLGAEVRGLNGMSLPNLFVRFDVVWRGNSGATLNGVPYTNPDTSRVVMSAVASDKAGNYDIELRVGSAISTIPVSQKTH